MKTMKKCWQIKNEINDTKAEILLYGTISDETWYGDEATPRQFAQDLVDLNGKDVLVRINSGGGDVFAGQAIYNQLKSYSGNVDVCIDGLAASAAVLIVCAGRTVTMPSNALLMIHNPAVGLFGYYAADEFGKMADYLATIKQTIINAYQQKCKDKISADEIATMMDEETWIMAEDAKKYGFADIVDADNPTENTLNEKFLVVNNIQHDLKKFQNIDRLKEIVNVTKIQEVPKLPTQNIQTTTVTDDTSNKDAINQAVTAERERCLALDDLAADGNPIVNAMVKEAKKDGKTVDDIKGYIDAVKNNMPKEAPAQQTQTDKAKDFYQQVLTDNKLSGTEDLTSDITSPTDEKAENEQAANFMATLINKRNGKDVK